MACGIIVNDHASPDDPGKAWLYDTTTGWAFGPVFASVEDAQAFLDWCRTAEAEAVANERLIGWMRGGDPRQWVNAELATMVKAWMESRSADVEPA